MSSTLPKLVLALTHTFDAWIVGSAANPNNETPRDFDVIVPFSKWEEASSLIPLDATPNHFGGWKCMSEGVEVDVWPGEVSSVIKNYRSEYIWHPYSNIRWKKDK